MSRDIGSFVTGLIIVAGLFVLVRPNSQGPKFVDAIGSATSGLLNAATGGGGWAAST
jgi:hypothetical protein